MSQRSAPEVDVLTGAWCRDSFLGALTTAVSRAKREHLTLTVLYVDVDDLQEQNDLHGDAAVDLALARVVELIAARLDGQGPIGRLVGGTFAAFLLDAGQDFTARAAEDIRRGAADMRWPWGSEGTPLTVSVGVAALRPLDAVLNVLHAAEDACRRAKQGGRNQVAVR